MYGHLNIILFAYGLDCLKEIHQVVKEAVLIHILIHVKQLFYARHTLRLPAGKLKPVGLFSHGLEHIFRVNLINLLLVVSQHRGTVRTLLSQIGTCPVKDRHEIIAHHLNSGLAQTLQSRYVVGNILLPVRSSHLNSIVYIHTLNSQDL